MDNGSKKKQAVRQWRFTQRKNSPPPLLHNYKSISPKVNTELQKYRSTRKISVNVGDREQPQSQSTQIQRLVSQFISAGQKYQGLIGSQTVKSLEHIEKSMSYPHSHENEEALRSIINAGEEYRRELLKAQQRKSRAEMQSLVAKKQIDSVHKQREALKVENILLKSQKSLMEKELMIMRDNADRVKRKYELDLYQSSNEIEEFKRKVKKLEERNREVGGKADLVAGLELTINDLEAIGKKKQHQIQKLRGENRMWQDKSGNTQRQYAQLFDNYTKLQVFCEGLKKQLAITKSYHSTTQANLSASKDQAYKLQQQRLKLLQQKNTALNKKNSELAIVNKKVQELNGLLHERERKIGEMEHLHGENNRKVQLMGHESEGSKRSVVMLENRVAELESQNRVIQEQVGKLGGVCKGFEEEVRKRDGKIQQLCQDFANKEIQWANALQKQQTQITNDFNSRIDEMGQVIDQKNDAIKEISFKLTEMQLECTALKEINANLREEIGDYGQQIKQKMERINAREAENKELELRKMESERSIVELKGRVKKIKGELEAQRSNCANLRETIAIKEQLLRKQEQQLHKKSQKISILTSTKQKILMDHKNSRQMLQKLTENINKQISKNSQLTHKNHLQAEQIKNMNQQIYQLRSKLNQYDQQMLALSKLNQQTTLKHQILQRQTQLKNGKLSEKEVTLNQQKELVDQLNLFLKLTIKKSQVLQKQLLSSKDAESSLMQERDVLSKMLANKTKENQKLKIRMIQAEETFKGQYVSNLQQLNNHHKKLMQQLEQEKERLLFEKIEEHGQVEQLLMVKKQSDINLVKKDEQNRKLEKKLEEKEGELCSSASQIGIMQGEVKKLNILLQDKLDEIQKVVHERQELSKSSHQKSLCIQQLNKELILQEQQLKNMSDLALSNQKQMYISQISERSKEVQECRKEMEMLALYKIKCGELEEQVLNLSNMVTFEKISNEDQAKRYDAVKKEMDRLQQLNREQNQTFNGQIKSRSQRYKSDYQVMRQEKQELKNQIQTLKHRVAHQQALKSSIQKQLQELSQRASRDVQNLIEQNQRLTKSNQDLGHQVNGLTIQSQNSLKEKEFILNSAINHEKINEGLVDKVKNIEKEYGQLESMIENLKEQRQIFVRKYMALANETQKNQKEAFSPAIKKEMQTLGDHFSQISIIHSQISKKLDSSKYALKDVSESKITFSRCDN